MFSKAIDSTHYFVQKTEIPIDLDVLRGRLTVRSKFKDNEPIKTYKETEDYFGIPRHYFDTGAIADEIIDARSFGTPVDIQFVGELRPRQLPLEQKFLAGVEAGSTGFILAASTGVGKTVMFLNYLAHLKTTALIVVPRSRIVDQWKERILQFTNLTEDDIGIAQQNVCNYEGKKIVIGMLHSLAKDKYPEEFKKYFGVVCFDELHTVAATTFSTVVGMFPARYRLGCSATLDRPDGMSTVFEWALGQCKIELKGTTDVVPKVILREYTTESTKHPYLHQLTDAKKRRGIIISALAEDGKRNHFLSSFITQIEQSGRRTLMLSDRTEQLKTVQAILVHKHGYNITEVGIFDGKTKTAEKERVLSSCKVILATYGVMNMAIDVPDLRGLVFGTPTSHAEQAVGRILRMCDDTKEPVVLDLIDTAYKECVRWAITRQSMYRKNKAVLVA